MALGTRSNYAYSAKPLIYHIFFVFASEPYEAMYMIMKGQVKDATTYLKQVTMIEDLFEVAS